MRLSTMLLIGLRRRAESSKNRTSSPKELNIFYGFADGVASMSRGQFNITSA